MSKNGKDTFHALKRELVFGGIAGSIRTMGELHSLRDLIAEQWDTIYQRATIAANSAYGLRAGLIAGGLTEDHEAIMATIDLRETVGAMLEDLRQVYARDIALIDAFIAERSL